MSFDFTNRAVLLTGAAVGYGREMAERFAAAGAIVHGVDREPVAPAADRAGPGRIVPWQLDITDRAAVEQLLLQIDGEFGPVGVLVNNAGGTLGRQAVAVEYTAFADWDAILDVNLNAAFSFVRGTVAGMKRAGGGRIVNITSGAGVRPSRTGLQAYTAAKHALHGLTRQLAAELGPFGITVNAVAPGLQPVSPAVERQWAGYDEALRAGIIAAIPRRSLGTPRDVANAVMFLASDLAGYVTGQILPVNGGAF